MMATISAPNAAVPMWNMNVLPTEATTVNDPTWRLFPKYQADTDIAIMICGHRRHTAQRQRQQRHGGV